MPKLREKAQSHVEALKLELQDLDVAIFQAEIDNMPKPEAAPTPFLTVHHIEALATAAHGMSQDKQKMFTDMFGRSVQYSQCEPGKTGGCDTIDAS